MTQPKIVLSLLWGSWWDFLYILAMFIPQVTGQNIWKQTWWTHQQFSYILKCYLRYQQSNHPSGIIQLLNPISPQSNQLWRHRSINHWGRVTHICIGNLAIIGSDNGLSPGRRQAITWTNVGILLIGPLGTNFSEILIKIHAFSFKKMHLKNVIWRMAAILSRLQCVKVFDNICNSG